MLPERVKKLAQEVLNEPEFYRIRLDEIDPVITDPTRDDEVYIYFFNHQNKTLRVVINLMEIYMAHGSILDEKIKEKMKQQLENQINNN